jgi:hypothetical protein
VRTARILALAACLLTLGGAVAHGHPADLQDVDHDGVLNHQDNCPDAFNPKQSDIDGDAVYNAVPPVAPVNPTAPPPDTGGDACDIDDDGDKVDDVTDNCPKVPNADQADIDKDGKGNPCDSDDDGDDAVDEEDNCPTVANRDQRDADSDGLGDACDPDGPRARSSTGMPGFDPNDKTAPKLTIRVPRSIRLEAIRYGVAVRVSCSEACSLEGHLGRRRAGATLEDTGWTWLFLRPSPATFRRVKGSGPLKAQLRITAQDASGNRTSVRRGVTFRR